MNAPESIPAFFGRYAVAIERLDVPAIAEHYHLPCSFISSDAVVVQRDRDGLETLIAGVVGKYRSLGFGSVKITSLRTEILAAGLHEVRIHWEIAQADGAPLYDFDTVYVLIGAGGAVRIAAVLVVNENERYRALAAEIAGDRTYVGQKPG